MGGSEDADDIPLVGSPLHAGRLPDDDAPSDIDVEEAFNVEETLWQAAFGDGPPSPLPEALVPEEPVPAPPLPPEALVPEGPVPAPPPPPLPPPPSPPPGGPLPEGPVPPPPAPFGQGARRAPIAGQRSGQRADKYPRLAMIPPEDNDGKFHGIRCVVNPDLHGGKWDSMRAICSSHGARCELSRTLLPSGTREQQGRPLGFLWAWLAYAHAFDTKEAHCRSARDMTVPAVFKEFAVREEARKLAVFAIDALADPTQQEFWESAERPQRPGESAEPAQCP